eukprot:m.56493 g.56493  ORF g.56493 m.56493 type:complete len:219 (+) comp15583_c0_seq1:320-976(+)
MADAIDTLVLAREHSTANEHKTAVALYQSVMENLNSSSEPMVRLACINARFHLAVALFDGLSEAVNASPGSGLKSMMALANGTQDSEAITLDMRTEASVSANPHVRSCADILKSAQFLIGTAYLEGNGTLPDSSIAITWLLKAANNGDVQAMAALGRYYAGFMHPINPKYNTDGVDAAKARTWLSRAVDFGSGRTCSVRFNRLGRSRGIQKQNFTTIH